MSISTKASEETKDAWKTGSKAPNVIHPTYLIQRLNKPYKHDGIKPDEVFGFGGGHVRGGLSKEAFDLVAKLWSWDYMGAAEFEFGAVPKALDKLAQCSDLIAYELKIRGVLKVFNRRGEPERPKPQTKVVYVLAPKALVPHADEVIKTCAKNEDWGKLKEASHVNRALFESEDVEVPCRTLGWLELNNGFLFFKDREMWQNACRLFQVPVPEGSNA